MPLHWERGRLARILKPKKSAILWSTVRQLEESQRVTVLLHYPWLLLPAVPVLIVVIAFNFLGDALRDAADPYSD
jgi:ABC-type dipeptide/oligopeptide/nickel transport system permease subunit